MAEIHLTDLVLLGSHFQMWPEGSARPPAEDDPAPYQYPAGDFVKLSASATREEREFVLYLSAILDDVALPFKLDVLLGARFDVGDEALDAERAEPTLVWLCYPYLRELVSSITGRSPLPSYYLSALTRMPDPSVLHAGTDVSADGPTE